MNCFQEWIMYSNILCVCVCVAGEGRQINQWQVSFSISPPYFLKTCCSMNLKLTDLAMTSCFRDLLSLHFQCWHYTCKLLCLAPPATCFLTPLIFPLYFLGVCMSCGDRGQLAQVSSLLPPWGFQGSNADQKVFQHVPLPTESSPEPKLFLNSRPVYTTL